MNKKYISWQQLERYISSICQQIYESNWRPDYVVGIGRGGLVPSTMLSHYLNVPHRSLDVSLRDNHHTCSDCDLAELAFNGQNILLVDDINDEGLTLNWIIKDWQDINLPDHENWKTVWGNTVRFATIVDNLASDFEEKVNYTGTEINKAENNVWIVFPWEDWWATVD